VVATIKCDPTAPLKSHTGKFYLMFSAFLLTFSLCQSRACLIDSTGLQRMCDSLSADKLSGSRDFIQEVQKTGLDGGAIHFM